METNFTVAQCFIKWQRISSVLWFVEDTSITISLSTELKKKNWVKGFFCCLTLKTTSSSSYILNTLKYIFIYLYWVFTLLSLILIILWQSSTCFPIPKAESSSEFSLYFCKRKVKGILRRYTTWNAKDQHADIKFRHHWYEARPNAIRVYTQRKTHTYHTANKHESGPITNFLLYYLKDYLKIHASVIQF